MADTNGTFTITWKTPQRVREYQRSELIKLAKKRFLPCWLKIIIICIGLYYLLKPIEHLLTEHIMNFLLWGMPLYAGCLIGYIYWGPVLLSYFFHPNNTINHKGVYLHNASQSILYPWMKISGYYIRYDEPTETTILEFELPKRKKRRIIYLPDGPDAKKIVDIVAQRLPVLSSGKQEIPGKGELSSLEQAFFEGLTVLIAYGWAKLVLETMDKRGLFLAMLCMVLGSGTIGFILRRGLTFWRNPYYVSLAFAYNMCTSMVFMLWIAILMLYRLAEKIPAN